MKKQRGERNPSWKGGSRVVEGRVYIYDHNRPTRNKYIARSRVIAEKMIGRQLIRQDKIHHMDFDELNDAPSNLIWFNGDKPHMQFHSLLEKELKKKAGVFREYTGKRIHIYQPENQKSVANARLIMEYKLGRSLLTNEIVHHIDGDPLNDKLENLCLRSKSEHMKLHNVRRAKLRKIFMNIPKETLKALSMEILQNKFEKNSWEMISHE